MKFLHLRCGVFSHLPQLNQVRGFEAAARLGSFKAAGQELNLSPTAISHQISNLEDKLGVALFERKIRQVVLTEEGRRLALAVFQAFNTLSQTLDDISRIQSVLRVSTTNSFASLWLVPHLADFYRQYPDIQVEISTSDRLVDIARDRNVDIAVRYAETPHVSPQSSKLVTEHFGAYATQTYLDNNPNLEEMTLIETHWQNQALPPMTWSQHFSHRVATMPTAIKFDQEQHAIQAALAGQGVVLMSSVLADMAIGQKWLVSLGEDYVLPGFTYSIITSPHSGYQRKTEAFKQWLMTSFEGMRGE